MVYEYETKLLDYASGSKTYEEYKAMTQELQEVYRKAKAFDEINKILDVYLGNVEDELNALNLIREKLEDIKDE